MPLPVAYKPEYTVIAADGVTVTTLVLVLLHPPELDAVRVMVYTVAQQGFATLIPDPVSEPDMVALPQWLWPQR